MRPEDWARISYRIPKSYQNACDVANKIERTVKKIAIGTDKGIYLANDIVELNQQTKRLLGFILSEARIHGMNIEKLEKDLENIVKGIRKGEEERLEREIETRKTALVFYISNHQNFLGIFYDSLSDAITEMDKQFGKIFINILLRRAGLYPEVREEEKEKV